MSSTGIKTLVQFQLQRVALNSEPENIEKEIKAIKQAVLCDEELVKSVRLYKENKSVYDRAVRYASGGGTDSFVYNLYIQTHRNELSNYEQAVHLLASRGIESEKALFEIENKSNIQLARLEELLEQKSNTVKRAEQLNSAEGVVMRIKEADKQARNAVIYRPYRSSRTKSAGFVGAMPVKDLVEKQIEEGFAQKHYEIRYAKEAALRKAAESHKMISKKEQMEERIKQQPAPPEQEVQILGRIRYEEKQR